MPRLNLLIKPASSLCTMRCRYCYYSDVADNRKVKSYGMMTEDTLEALVRRAFDYATGFVGFAFQGGEPTLAGLDFYRRLIRLQAQYNTRHIRVSNSIQTNGYALDDEWAAFLAAHHFLVGLSLDGTRETHNALRPDAEGKGTFDRVANAARLLEKHGVAFNILCVVSDLVARHPIKVYERLKKYRYIQFIPCLDPLDGSKTEYALTAAHYTQFLTTTFGLYYRDLMQGDPVSVRNFDNYIRILLGERPESCAMNGYCTCYGVVEGDGSVYPCDFYVLDEWRLGSVHTDSLTALFSSDKAEAFIRQSQSVPDECADCRYRALCRNGCFRERTAPAAGEIPVNRHCAALRAFFDACLPHMLDMADRIRTGGYIP